MGHNYLPRAILFSTATILFWSVAPAASLAQDRCRTAQDDAEIKRLETEIQALRSARDQIEIDWRAHRARYDTLVSGLPKTQKLVDEAAATINNDAQRYAKASGQIVNDADALTALQSKPCPPKEKPAKGETPEQPLAPPANSPPPAVTPKEPAPVIRKCRTPESEVELKRLKDERSKLNSKLVQLKGPIKRAARALNAAERAAKADPVGHGAEQKAAEDAFNALEKQKHDTEYKLKSVEAQINHLEEMAPCPPPEPDKTVPPQTDIPPIEPPKLPPAEVLPQQKQGNSDTPHTEQPPPPPPDLKPEPDNKKRKSDKGLFGLGIHIGIGIDAGHKHDDDREHHHRDRDDEKSHPSTEPADR